MRNRVQKTFTQPTLTQQHSKDEVDINNIMARYIKTGVLDHVTKYEAQYIETSECDYHQSMNIIRKADEMFLELPAKVRKQFDNDPGEFLSFVENPVNHSKLAEMGLTKPPMSPTSDNPAHAPATVQPTETPSDHAPASPSPAI